ncbi:TPA: hypothetical protein RRI59_000366 [Klebsiella pneumoniae]|uniref:hypothetical protein n=1 Tax=Enterobacteriaceae TaxID=543 RepID=UPI0026E3424A|nr:MULTISPECIES: hypothetical protein [Enterobacteriaceae]MDP1003315.1 hypothetical protein [Klebsiella pneumoniae]WKW40232.1 hypothetical protein PZO51_23230 [Enterobacter mori]HDY9042735.1 hypothetical protein [Klebsiella pneumoniae]
MRKAFRMKYEPCLGTCYIDRNVADLSFLANDLVALREIVIKMIKAHEPLCGNEGIAYGIDFDEENNLFIAFFLHFGKVELLSDKSLIGVLHHLCDVAIEHFESDTGKDELKSHPGSSHDVCEHGKDNDLLHFMIKHSGIETPDGVGAFIDNMMKA